MRCLVLRNSRHRMKSMCCRIALVHLRLHKFPRRAARQKCYSSLARELRHCPISNFASRRSSICPSSLLPARKIMGERALVKMSKVNARFFWHMHTAFQHTSQSTPPISQARPLNDRQYAFERGVHGVPLGVLSLVMSIQ